MKIMLIISTILIVIFFLMLYLIYQLARNNKVYLIRHDWISSNDRRYIDYTYNYMFDADKHNWYGLKYPKESHFK